MYFFKKFRIFFLCFSFLFVNNSYAYTAEDLISSSMKEIELPSINGCSQKRAYDLPEDINRKNLDRLLSKMIDDISQGACDILLYTDSMGGSLGDAIFFARFLRNLPDKVTIHTRVTDICASACTVIYASGKKRTAAPSSKFMFHSARLKTACSNCRELVNDVNRVWLEEIAKTDIKLANYIKTQNILDNKSDYYIKSGYIRENFSEWITA